MFTPLIEYFKSTKPENISRIALEEIALIQALLDSWSNSSTNAEKFAFVPGLVKNWLNLDFEALTPAFNMRLQPLLRDTLNALIENGVNALNPSQTQYLIAVSNILENVKGTDKNNRLLKLFRHHKEDLQKKLAGEEAVGLPDLLGDFRFTTSNEIEKAPRRKTTTFGGIDLALNGRMLTHQGSTKVLDSVPEDTMLTVEGGSCYVSGKGNVHARNIINKAYVVSKWSDVIAENAQDPELVFVGNKIHIHAKALLGTYVAPIIQVDGEVSGGELTFSETCESPKIAYPQSRNLALEMQEKISCDVYGGLVDPEVGKIIADINKTKTRHGHVTRMIKVIHTECEHFAGNGIMYLLGGDLVQKQIEEIATKQRRISFLDSIINGIDGIAHNARIELIQQQRRREKRQSTVQGIGGMEEINEELVRIKDDSELDKDLAEEGKALHNMTLAPSRRDPVEFAAVNKLDAKKQRWLQEKERVNDELSQSENLFKKSLAQNDVIKAHPETASRIQLFNMLIQNTKGKSNQDSVLRRSRTNFIQHVIRTIDQRKHRMLKYRNLLGTLSEEHDLLCQKLKTKHNLDPPVDEEDKPSPIAKGVFDQNVIICTDKYLIDASKTQCDGLHVTTASRGIRSYSITENKISQIE